MKRKLLFINLGKLSNNSGHTSRLRYGLEVLGKNADVSILSLTGEVDQISIERYSKVQFYNLPIEFRGWSVVDLDHLLGQIHEKINLCTPDIVILCIEIWDLIVGLQKELAGKIAFCAVCHAVPFLGSPLHPTKSFESEVKKVLSERVAEYRRNYIFEHYKEFPEVINSNILIANNATVSYYFKNYFPKSTFWEQRPHVTIDSHQDYMILKSEYDFCYMARMEKGKGLEYLDQILIEISTRLGRKIKVAIMGRADDKYSKCKLRHLIQAANEFYSVTFFGWTDDKTKAYVLRKSGCFIYPSIYDNFPTVVNEALAYGLPVVLWDTIFYRANYRDVKSISATPLFNIKTFASMAVDLLKRRAKLGHYSLEYVKNNGDSDLVAKDDLKLFENIIKYYENIKQ